MDLDCNNIESMIDFITNGDVSDLSELSSDEEQEDELIVLQDIQQKAMVESSDDDDDDDDDDDGDYNVPLAHLATGQKNDIDATAAPPPEAPPPEAPALGHVYRWRKRDRPQATHEFTGNFSDPPEVEMSPRDYFKQFFTDEIVSLIVDQSNLYSTQKHGKCVNTNVEEMYRYIGMHILMGVVNLPAYTLYWSKELRYASIANVMSLKRFEFLRRSLHVVDNNTFNPDDGDKLFKIRPLLEAVRNECIKVDPEECHSVDEQIIPSKTKRTKIRQYNPKKPKKWGFKNLVRAGASGFMYDFYLYAGKENDDNPDFQGLQKCAQVVAKLCKDLPRNVGHKVFFDNWFSTLELILYLKNEGLLAAGTIRANRLHNCPLKANKDIEKEGRGSMDYRTDNNSCIIIAKWVDNSTMQLVSNFVGIEPVGSIQRWNKIQKARMPINCSADCYGIQQIHERS